MALRSASILALMARRFAVLCECGFLVNILPNGPCRFCIAIKNFNYFNFSASPFLLICNNNTAFHRWVNSTIIVISADIGKREAK